MDRFYDGILGEIFPGFMWDLYRITLELSKDPNVIILASWKNLRNILIHHSKMKSGLDCMQNIIFPDKYSHQLPLEQCRYPCTAHPPLYWWYDRSILHALHCTDDAPPPYRWCDTSVPNIFHLIDDMPPPHWIPLSYCKKFIQGEFASFRWDFSCVCMHIKCLFQIRSIKIACNVF